MKTQSSQLSRECVQIALKVFGVLALVIAVIMILQYVNIMKFNPESSQVIPELKQQLLVDKDNAELQNYVRELDLLARRSWFVAQEQLRLGGYILAGLVALLLLGVLYLNLTAAKKTDLQECTGEERAASMLRYALSVVGLIFCGGAVAISQMNPQEEVATATAPEEAEPIVAPEEAKVAEIAYATAEDFAKNWTQFRGSQHNSHAQAQTLFTDWSVEEEKNILWTVDVPLCGFSSPIKWGNQLFITGGDKTNRKIFSYNAADGTLLWEHDASGIEGSPAEAPKVTDDTGYAASTPATDGVRIFAAFATGDLVAVDMQGNRIWAKHLGELKNPYGYASSMVTTTNTLFVQYDNEEEQIIYLFDSATGEEIWKKKRDVTTSWSTPVLVDDEAVVLVTSSTVEAYDLKTGDVLWSHEIMSGEVAVAPVYVDGKIIVANDNATAACIDMKSGEIIWESTDFDLPDVSTPVAYEGMLILCTSGGIIEGVDLESGELLWEQELDYGFYNSILVVGKQMIVFDMEGTAHIFTATNDGYEAIETKSMGELVVAMPIAEENTLWVRSKNQLYCFGIKKEGEQ